MIYQDLDPETGFVLVPDLKWDQKETENLYVLAIVRRRGILSLRELRPDHLTLLRKVLEKGKVCMFKKWKVLGAFYYFNWTPALVLYNFNAICFTSGGDKLYLWGKKRPVTCLSSLPTFILSSTCSLHPHPFHCTQIWRGRGPSLGRYYRQHL